MKFTLENYGLSVRIENFVLNEIIHYAKRNPFYEFGGVLIGCYSSPSDAKITNIIFCKSEKPSAKDFIRTTEGLENQLLKNRENGLFYIGEWHTHMDGNALYSPQDLKAMCMIAKDKGVKISSPLLLILGFRSSVLNDIRLFLLNKSNLRRFCQCQRKKLI